MWGIEHTKHLTSQETKMTDETPTTGYFTIREAQIEVPITAAFKPLEDITAYELTTLLPYLLGSPLYQKQYDEMTPNVKRHLRR